jgi:hypothetical protein
MDGRSPVRRIAGLLVLGSLFATANAVLANAVGDSSAGQAAVVFVAAVICGVVALGLGWQINRQAERPPDPPRTPAATAGTAPPPSPGRRGPATFVGRSEGMRVSGYLVAGGAAWTVAFWPFLLVQNEIGLLSLLGVLVAAPAGYAFLYAWLRLPRLTLTTEGIILQRTLVGPPLRIRWDEVANLEKDPRSHKLAVDFTDPKATKGLPILLGHGGRTLCDLRSLDAEEADVLAAIRTLRP